MNPPSVAQRAPVVRRRFARFRYDAVRRYYALDRDAWYAVVGEEPDGIWIEWPGIGDPFMSPDRRFVFREDFDLRDD